MGRVRARGLRGNRVAATHGIREPPAVRLSNAHPGYAVLIGVARAVHENCGVSLGEHLEIIGYQVALRSGTQIRCPA